MSDQEQKKKQNQTAKTTAKTTAKKSSPLAQRRKAAKAVLHGDFLLIALVVALVVFGVIMVFSASYYSMLNTEEGPFAYLRRAAIWSSVGLALMVVAIFVPYKLYRKWAPLALIVGVLLLCAVFTPLGHTAGNATRWIKIGPLTFMPGELVKITSIWGIAWYFTKYQDRIRSFTQGLLPVILLMGINFVLIYKQPNLSTALIVCGIILATYFFAGGNFLYILGMLGAGGAGVLALIFANKEGEHMKRIVGYLDPFSDAQGEFYQLVQSLLALGAGGVTGTGPGRSVQKALYLPEAQNDFIFAIIGEEFGFVGCVALLLVYLLLIWRCTLVAINAPDKFAMLTAGGITAMLALQVTMNIGVVTGVIPPTGVILPFISYGGNAIVVSLIAMGIMMNISRQSEMPPRKKKKKKPASPANPRTATRTV